MTFNKNKFLKELWPHKEQPDYAKMSKDSGVNRSTLWRIIEHGAKPNIENMALLCRYIKKPFESFFK